MKKVKLFLLTKILPFILQLLVRIIYLTSKKEFHYTKVKNNEPMVVAFWHCDLLMQPFNYLNFKKHGTVKAMISHHKDGEIIANTVEHLGIGALRGSSSKGAVRVFVDAIRQSKRGVDIAFTPDGPRGPRFSVADGVVALSKKTGAKIFIFNCVPSKYWQMNSWDKFIIPKPFGTLKFYIQDPLDVKNLEMHEAKKILKERMLINVVI